MSEFPLGWVEEKEFNSDNHRNLYMDDSEEGKKAKIILDEADIVCQPAKVRKSEIKEGTTFPQLITVRNAYFGLSDILIYVKAFLKESVPGQQLIPKN